jgi:hypothetical protein
LIAEGQTRLEERNLDQSRRSANERWDATGEPPAMSFQKLFLLQLFVDHARKGSVRLCAGKESTIDEKAWRSGHAEF